MSSSNDTGPKVDYKPEYNWAGRSLENYKAMHRGSAMKKGVGEAFQSAKTLTAAKKVLFGMKRGNTK